MKPSSKPEEEIVSFDELGSSRHECKREMSLIDDSDGATEDDAAEEVTSTTPQEKQLSFLK
jgi:hypothetical protein